MRRAALGNHLACATLALTALRGHPELKLDLVEAHAGTRVAGDFPV